MANSILNALGFSGYQSGIQNVAQLRVRQQQMDAVPQTAFGETVPDATKAKLWEKAKEFEAYFVQQFMDLTSPDLSENALMGGGLTERAFSQKLNEEMAKGVVKQGGFGLASRVYGELLQAQEGGAGRRVALPGAYNPQTDTNLTTTIEGGR